MSAISSGVFVVTDETGMVLATLTDWSLALAQGVAKNLEGMLQEPTFLHYLRFTDRAPAIGETVSMKGVSGRPT